MLSSLYERQWTVGTALSEVKEGPAKELVTQLFSPPYVAPLQRGRVFWAAWALTMVGWFLKSRNQKDGKKWEQYSKFWCPAWAVNGGAILEPGAPPCADTCWAHSTEPP